MTGTNFRRTRGIKRNGALALTPLLVFAGSFLLLSILLNDFYKTPVIVVFILASVYAISITRGLDLGRRITLFSRGAGNDNLMLMVWIFVMAGAFAETAKAMGAIEEVVELTLTIMPSGMLLPGLFVATCMVSFAIGTSVGTIVALVPVAIGIAGKMGVDTALLVAIVVGGSFFGDNLSFISDTTVAASRTQGCKLSDKFKVNFRIVMPAAVIVFILYTYIGMGFTTPEAAYSIDWVKILPYLFVIVAAVMGMNVLLVLTIGIGLTAAVGLGLGSFDMAGCLGAMGSGIAGMGELIIVSMLAGGLLELIRYNGGITYLIKVLTRRVNTRRGAELGIAALVSLANLCTANNTVAIISVGSIARDIAERYGVDKRKSASILDTFSCLVQGMIPYGAQLLIAAGLAGVSAFSIIPYLYYPFVMGAAALIAIFFGLPRRYS